MFCTPDQEIRNKEIGRNCKFPSNFGPDFAIPVNLAFQRHRKFPEIFFRFWKDPRKMTTTFVTLLVKENIFPNFFVKDELTKIPPHNQRPTFIGDEICLVNLQHFTGKFWIWSDLELFCRGFGGVSRTKLVNIILRHFNLKGFWHAILIKGYVRSLVVCSWGCTNFNNLTSDGGDLLPRRSCGSARRRRRRFDETVIKDLIAS